MVEQALATSARRAANGFVSPLVLAHRGASGYRPEHTLPAYELGVAMGADYIEPDLVMTRDGVLVDRHEPEISETTDVARRPEFAHRRTTRLIDGMRIDGWWAEDFTLEELKTLRAVERIPRLRPANTAFDGLYEVPTFDELLDLRAELSATHGRTIGIIPEIKNSTYHHSVGLDPEEATLAAVERAGLNHHDAPLWIQSFEVANLVALRERFGYAARLLFLNGHTVAPYDFVAAGDSRTYLDLLTPAGLEEMAQWIDGIAPEKVLVIPRHTDGRLGEPTRLIADAHATGLAVMPWTFRAENHFLPADYRVADAEGVFHAAARGHAVEEALVYLAAGVDGMFCDNTDVYVEARARFAMLS